MVDVGEELLYNSSHHLIDSSRANLAKMQEKHEETWETQTQTLE